MAGNKTLAVRPCATKIPWATQDLAEGHVLLMLKDRQVKDPERLNAYRCPHCDFWHVGHGYRVVR